MSAENTSLLRIEQKEPKFNLDDEISKSEIRLEKQYKQSEDCIMIKQGIHTLRYATYGNFGAIIGKQKSRKTTYYAMPMSAAICDNVMYDKFMAYTSGKVNVIVDTEQSERDIHYVINRLIRICGLNNQPENFKAYGLKAYNPVQRVEIIDEIFNRVKNLGYVIIDGVKDLVYDINNPVEGTEIATQIMKWVADYNCHIDIVIHVNKGKGNIEPRGHVGTEIQNKAESVFLIEKLLEKERITRVTPKDLRGFRKVEMKPFGFSIDETGLPFLTDLNEYSSDEF